MADVYEDFGRCGSCRSYEVAFSDRLGRTMGQCFRKPRRATVPAHDHACEDYRLDRSRLIPGAKVPDDLPDESPRERQRRMQLERASRSVQRRTKPRAAKPLPSARVKIQQIPLGQGDDMDREELKSLLAEVLDEAFAVSDPPIHPRYHGGKLIIQPGNTELASKEIDLEIFFRKITSVRDKLRVLEQKVNSHKDLSTEDRAQMQGYISGCYGALKTFNMLFADRDDWFSN